MPLGEELAAPDPEVPLDEPPPAVLPDALPLGCADWSLDDELELELGLLGVAELPEDELGELGVVALPDTELELDLGRLVVSLDEPALEPDVVPVPLAPRLASPPRSQP